MIQTSIAFSRVWPWLVNLNFITGKFTGGKKPIKSKKDLEYRLYVVLEKLKRNVEKIRSFFKLPETRYAGLQETPA
jgi:hypothetical protein